MKDAGVEIGYRELVGLCRNDMIISLSKEKIFRSKAYGSANLKSQINESAKNKRTYLPLKVRIEAPV